MNNVDIAYSEFTASYARACEIFAMESETDFSNLETEIVDLMEQIDTLYLECKEEVCSWLIQKENDKGSHVNSVAKSSHSSVGSHRSSKLSKGSSKKSSELSLRQ